MGQFITMCPSKVAMSRHTSSHVEKWRLIGRLNYIFNTFGIITGVRKWKSQTCSEHVLKRRTPYPLYLNNHSPHPTYSLNIPACTPRCVTSWPSPTPTISRIVGGKLAIKHTCELAELFTWFCASLEHETCLELNYAINYASLIHRVMHASLLRYQFTKPS